MSARPKPPPIERLVPHREGMLLLASIADYDADRIAAVGRVPASCPLAGPGGGAPAILGVEMGAQAAAALEALRAGDAGAVGGPRRGYLVGIKRAHLAVATLPVERALAVSARRTGGAAALSIYEIEVAPAGGGEPLVAATLSTWAEDAPPPALRQGE